MKCIHIVNKMYTCTLLLTSVIEFPGYGIETVLIKAVETMQPVAMYVRVHDTEETVECTYMPT